MNKLNKQIDIFGNEVEPLSKRKPKDKEKMNWENAFQNWSNEMQQESTDIYGKCGYGSMCDYCEDNSYGKPCIRALNAMCREHCIKIDYSKREFENIWEMRIKERV